MNKNDNENNGEIWLAAVREYFNASTAVENHGKKGEEFSKA